MLLVTDARIDPCADFGVVVCFFSFLFKDFLACKIWKSSKICKKRYWSSSRFRMAPLFLSYRYSFLYPSFKYFLLRADNLRLPRPITRFCSTTWPIIAGLSTQKLPTACAYSGGNCVPYFIPDLIPIQPISSLRQIYLWSSNANFQLHLHDWKLNPIYVPERREYTTLWSMIKHALLYFILYYNSNRWLPTT